MNFSAGSGGLMLIAFAAVWFIVFVPTWARRGEPKDQSAELRRASLDKKLDSKSRNVRTRLQALRIGSVLLGAAGAITTLASALQAQYWVTAAGSGVLLLSLIGVRLSVTRARSLTADGYSRRTKIPAGSLPANSTTEAEAETNPRAWRAEQIPAQTYQRRVGKLETPKLADVVELEVQEKLDSETLDEILRRRRAN